ncbi:hypothetical protein LCGC14_2020890, partial [marine sediment metagenome]
VHGRLQPRQHGGRRGADPFASEAGLPIGRRARRHGPVDPLGLSGGHQGGPARGVGDGHPPASGEHSQRGRGRLRPADLRALRRQAHADHRRRRNGRRNPPLPAGRRGKGHYGRQPQLRAGRPIGRKMERPGAALGQTVRGPHRSRPGDQHHRCRGADRDIATVRTDRSRPARSAASAGVMVVLSRRAASLAIDPRRVFRHFRAERKITGRRT